MLFEHLNNRQRKGVARVCHLWRFLGATFNSRGYLLKGERPRTLEEVKQTKFYIKLMGLEKSTLEGV